MGVLIGDEPVFIFPSFIAAASEEILARAKRKFYEPFNLSVQNLQRKTAKIETSIRDSKSASKAYAAGRSFLLDAVGFYLAIRRRSLFLDIKKEAGGSHFRLLFE